MRIAPLLRGLLLLLLATVIFLPLGSARGESAAGAVWLPEEPFDAAAPGPVYDSLLAGSAPDLVVRSGLDAPTAAELDALAAIANRVPVTAAMPDAAGALRLEPPMNPRAQRTSGLSFHLLGTPGDTILVHLGDATGVLDSLRVAVDSTGRVAGGFGVRPSTAGWHEWWVAAASDTARTGAWVGEAMPIRVLVAAGPPTWESRFVVRALEETGVEVELIQPLGRDLSLGGAPRSLPASAQGLAEYDAVLVLASADPSDAELEALEVYVAERGGGVMLGGASADATFGVRVADGDLEVSGELIEWSLPPALVELPPTEVRVAATTLAARTPGAHSAAAVPQGQVVVLRSMGRGRIAALGLSETWRWRMQAGSLEEHRAFWRSLVEWLASGLRDPVRVELESPLGPIGTQVRAEVLLYGTASPSPGDSASGAHPDLVIMRPDGRSEALTLGADPDRPTVLHAAFVPATAGVYSLRVDGEPLAGFHAVPDVQPAASAWPRLALLAERSGGAAVPADSVDAVVQRKLASGPRPGSDDELWMPLLFGLLIALAATEWGIRRLSGRP